MYEKYKNPISIEEELYAPTWCDNECEKYFFLKQLKNEMVSDKKTYFFMHYQILKDIFEKLINEYIFK